MANTQTKKHGPLFWGLIALVGGVVAVGLCVVGVAFWARNTVMNATATEAVPVPVAEVEQRELRKLNDKYLSFRQALKQGQTATFKFSDRDLNGLVAKLPELKHLRGKASFTIERGEFVVDACVPLNGLPGMEGRYINGRFTLDISSESGRPVIRPVDVQTANGEVPQVILSHLRDINILDKLTKRDANARTLMNKISGLEIREGKLVIDTGHR